MRYGFGPPGKRFSAIYPDPFSTAAQVTPVPDLASVSVLSLVSYSTPRPDRGAVPAPTAPKLNHCQAGFQRLDPSPGRLDWYMGCPTPSPFAPSSVPQEL